MEQQNRKVKITCTHRLRYQVLSWAKSSEKYEYRERAVKCGGCDSSEYWGYYCSICEFGVHEECIDYPDIVNHRCHTRHPLKKVSTKTVGYTDGTCHFCMGDLGDEMYHCALCNFSIDLRCWVDGPQVTIYQPKSHNHTFTIMPIKVSFTCTACGMGGDRNPYVCLECGFMLHEDCIGLPRVININRHDHRISRTYHLGHGDWECGVCREKMDWSFGGFSCKRCPSYAVHSKCATRRDVWDGKELEDVPEEEEEEDPYKVIDENEIIHMSHEHNLRLLRLGDDNDTIFEKMLCDACILPVSSDAFFKCVQCEFFLHKECASLPRKKRNIMHEHKLTLKVDCIEGKHFKCTYCLEFFDGFRYECDYSHFEWKYILCVRCASIYEPFHHELHPHPLYRISTKKKACGACGQDSRYVLSCTVCEFALGMECANLPRKWKHRCDDHVLSLHHGAGSSIGLLWCDICEAKTDPTVWFYGCDDCGVTLHTKCVLGEIFHLKPVKRYIGGEIVSNVSMSRPPCVVCEKRCMFPSFLRGLYWYTKPNNEVCSVDVHACSVKCTKGCYLWGDWEWRGDQV
ncbi:unnamed protein product [Microthlaspi erraticum]|uniref:Zinc finger PHD-type domain-containing protein n=1 Tax=Microthlaspi erraticum TaxID=1685480 RepID=A0A6D2JZR4_9BRAS|nr:unnamed protein product [Microthlaspi erraticum]